MSSQDAQRHVDLLRLIFEGDSLPTYSSAEASTYLDILGEDHESTLALISRVLSTGTDSGKLAAKKALRTAFNVIHYEYKQSHLNLDWKDKCPDFFYPKLNHRLICVWNIENVVSEAGYTGDTVAVEKEVQRHFLHKPVEDWPIEKQDVSIRGYIAFTIAAVPFKTDSSKRARAQLKAADKYYEDTKRFIAWSGSHSDIRSVITTANERQTIDVDMLAPIVEAPVSPAVAQGIL